MLYNERAGGEDRGEKGRRRGRGENGSDGPWGGDSSLLLTFFYANAGCFCAEIYML